MLMPSIVRVRPVVVYFVLTFALSWGGVLMLIGGWPRASSVKAQDHPLFTLAVLATLAGPSVAGLALTGALEGVRGLRDLAGRLLCRDFDPRWYAAVLVAPLVSLATTFALGTAFDYPGPALLTAGDPAGVAVLAVVVGLLAGFCEEVGWTGFAIPRLLARHGVIASGLLVGSIWSAWHLVVVIWGMGGRNGDVPLGVFVALDGLGMLPAFRVLMVLVYARTDSLGLAVLLHASLTVTAIALTPPIAGWHLLVHGLLVAALVWALVAAVVHGSRPRVSDGGPQRAAARAPVPNTGILRSPRR